ncbi:MAG: hypothetical protein J6S71_06885 [Clostridia bacterium]|nr:hypothetical protein [Clostridia bacterium]
MSDSAHVKTDQLLAEMEKELTEIYTRAEQGVIKAAQEYVSNFRALDEKKRKLVKAGKLSEDEYQKWRKNKLLYGRRYAEMKEECAQQIARVNETALAYVNGKLPEVYALNYNALESSVNGVGGYSFTLTDANTVKALAGNDKSLLPYKKLDLSKDIPWNMKNINSEMLQGVLLGESVDKIAKRLHNVQEMNRTQAIRSARTIVTGAENKGRQDSYERAEKDGIKLQREWIATNDYRTRHAHALLDGQLADVDKPFKSELGDIMYPGDPSAHPSNVYNCRCTLAARVISIGGAKVNKKLGYADRETVQDLIEKDPKEFDIRQKMLYNKKADKEQYNNYKSRLGGEAPRNFSEFQEIKYRDVEKYEDLVGYYRYKGVSPESDRRFYEAHKAKKRLKQSSEIRAKGMVVYPKPITAIDVNIHAEKQMKNRNISIKEAQRMIDTSKFALRQQNGEIYAFYSESGFVAIDTSGMIRTAGALDTGGINLYEEVVKYVGNDK